MAGEMAGGPPAAEGPKIVKRNAKMAHSSRKNPEAALTQPSPSISLEPMSQDFHFLLQNPRDPRRVSEGVFEGV